MAEGEGERTAAPGWLQREGRLRSGWRIAVYLALYFGLSLPGVYFASVLPRDAIQWVNLINSTACAVVAGWIVLARLDGRPLDALGFRLSGALGETAKGLLLGGALMAGAAGMLLASGGLRFAGDSGTLPQYLGELGVAFAFFWIAAAFEEALFRGYAFQALVEGIGVWPAVAISSALFSYAHAGNPNIQTFGFLNIFLAGVWLALAYLRTRSLWFATAAHMAWNWVMATLLDLPVSGLTEFDTPLYEARETGADWWTGGAFGPEAGLAGTLVLVAGIAWLVRTRALREAEEVRADRPLVDARLGPEGV